jgi:hypothetical protein
LSEAVRNDETNIALAPYVQKSRKAAVVQEVEEDPNADLSIAEFATRMPTNEALEAKVGSILASIDLKSFQLQALMQQLSESPALFHCGQNPATPNWIRKLNDRRKSKMPCEAESLHKSCKSLP